MALTKSDFILADDCLAKLYFKKNKYPSNADNSYRDYLARIGHITGYLAQLTLGPGTEIGLEEGLEQAVQKTKEWLKSNQRGVLFEATFEVEGRLVRVDVLRKEGKNIELIEVKSSGFDSLQWYGDERKKLLKSLEGKIKDLAFQTAVVERALPDCSITPYLSLIDKNTGNEVEGLYGNFVVTQNSGPNKGSVGVAYTGDVDELLAQFLLFPPVSMQKEVDALKEEVWRRSEVMVQALQTPSDFEPFKSPRKMACGTCEFRLKGSDSVRSGFAQCWGADADVEPHILNIRRDAAFAKVLNPHVAKGLSDLTKIPADLLQSKEGPRVYGIPALQMNGVREHFDDAGRNKLKKAEYPMYFIDFEAVQPAIPFHQGMMPYRSVVLFQWSCHKVAHEGAPVEHFEFLNTEKGSPNTRFLAALKEVLGDVGTVITWSSYENTQLRKQLVEQLEFDNLDDSELVDWLRGVLKEKDGGWRQLDLHDDVVKRYYYHHRMGNRTSIKAVLPAVLSEQQPQVNRALLQAIGLHQPTENGGLTDPYSLLSGVKDGTQAMTTYEQLQFGIPDDATEEREALARQLLDYCRLDTLSMVLIFNYLKEKEFQA